MSHLVECGIRNPRIALILSPKSGGVIAGPSPTNIAVATVVPYLDVNGLEVPK